MICGFCKVCYELLHVHNARNAIFRNFALFGVEGLQMNGNISVMYFRVDRPAAFFCTKFPLLWANKEISLCIQFNYDNMHASDIPLRFF